MRSNAPALVFTLVASLVGALATATGCAKPAANAGDARSGSPEPETRSGAVETRALEEKAAGYAERFGEIQASDMSAEQKAQAAAELVDEQQRTVREAEDGTAGDSEADPQE